MKKFYLELNDGKDDGIKGYMLDLSRGGMAIACSRMPDKDSIIQIKIKNDPLTVLKAKIISVSSREDKIYAYRLGLKFTAVLRKTDKLGRFIGQSEKRKKVRLSLL